MYSGLKIYHKLIFAILSVSLCSCTFFAYSFRSNPYFTEADRAEALQKEGKFKQAIQAYQKHIKNRLSSKKKLPKENPYFYKLMIGDLHLKLDNVDKAESAYLEASANKVSPALCADRLKKIGKYFEERKDFEKAFEILKKHRTLDPLLFDLEIDRMHKSMVNSEKKQSESKEK